MYILLHVGKFINKVCAVHSCTDFLLLVATRKKLAKIWITVTNINLASKKIMYRGMQEFHPKYFPLPFFN